MFKRSLLLLVATFATADAAFAGDMGGYSPRHGGYSSIGPAPLVGPVHVLYPASVRPYGYAPAALGTTMQWTTTSHICRVDTTPHATCYLYSPEAVGTDCGCPPAGAGYDWQRGYVSAY